MHQESNQLAISFDLHKPEFSCLARNTDPQTSIDAARVVQRLGITELHKRLILDALRTYGPMTAKEIGRKIGLTNVQVSQRSGELVGIDKPCFYTDDKPREGCKVWCLSKIGTDLLRKHEREGVNA